MLNSDKKVELLAPAGGWDALRQAVYNNADAIYFGFGSLNARVKADNFENILEVVSFCHLFGVKAYLAINIAIFDEEIDDVTKVIIDAAAAKIDAFIISDTSLLSLILQYAPNIAIHASTQMGIHNRYGAEVVKNLGFDRVILSREVEIDDIIDIKKNVDIELEVFVHGALCVGFSGSCLFSSVLSGDSGNRGRCNQLCRHKYVFEETNKEGYLLSASDICMIARLKELANAGVCSFKIEGRLKRSEYVAGVTSIYRKCIDNNFIFSKSDIDDLKRLFNRGDFNDGYNQKNDRIIYSKAPSSLGLPIGKVVKIENCSIEIISSQVISVNDGFKILRDGVEVGNAIGEGYTSLANNKYRLKCSGEIKINDVLSITTDGVYNSNILNKIRKIKIDIYCKVKINEQIIIKIKVCDSPVSIEVEGEMVQMARSAPLKASDISTQVSKVGANFELNNVEIETDNSSFIPVSNINSIRREALNALADKIMSEQTLHKTSNTQLDNNVHTNRYDHSNDNINTIYQSKNDRSNPGLYIEVDTLDKLSETTLDNTNNVCIVYAPKDYNCIDTASILNYRELYNNILIYIKLEVFASTKDLQIIEKIDYKIFDGIMCNNYYGFKIAKDNNIKFLAGYNLNITNNSSLMINLADDYIISTEINSHHIINKLKNGVIYAFGHIPLMYFRHCPKQTVGLKNCANCNIDEVIILSDRKEKYKISRTKTYSCSHTMYNPICTNLLGIAKMRQYVDFSLIRDKEIINAVLHNKTIGFICTKGHYNRGVK